MQFTTEIEKKSITFVIFGWCLAVFRFLWRAKEANHQKKIENKKQKTKIEQLDIDYISN